MKNSYFAKAAENKNAVAICVRSPSFYTGRVYKKLAPKLWFLRKYKKDSDKVFYRKQYYKEVLNKLDPEEVYEELGEDAILLCWEAPGKFCHRHIVAKWFTTHLGIKVREL